MVAINCRPVILQTYKNESVTKDLFSVHILYLHIKSEAFE